MSAAGDRARDDEELSKYRLLAEEARDIMLFVRASDGRIVEANAAAEAAYGYSREELLQLGVDRLRTMDEQSRIAAQLQAAQSGGVLFETYHRRKDGSSFPVEVSSRGPVVVDGRAVVLSVVRDISERRRTQAALQASEERYRILAETSPDYIYIIDREGRFRYVNSKGAEAVGRCADDLVGSSYCDLFGGDTLAHMAANIERVFQTGKPLHVEIQWVFPDGREVWVATWLVPMAGGDGGVEAVFGVSRDVSDRIRAQQTALERSHFLEELLEAIPVPVFYKDAELRYLGCNRAFAADVGCPREQIPGKSAFDFYPPPVAERLTTGDLEVLAHLGREVECEVRIVGGDAGERVIATHKAAYSAVDGDPAGVVGVYLDLTEIRRAEAGLKARSEQLRRTVEGAVTALGAVTEMRDPYTAGHQRRVAELAALIAAELGWSEEQTRELQTAALLHDIGKTTIPAEILAKPGRLNDAEMRIIRQHPDAGADTVVGIDAGSAIADIIRQHHERPDGSGYPSGLRGEQILPEAAVLAVADVVEAMVSHRPYRPALSVEQAVAEIEDGAGSRYDTAACAACIEILREGRFSFEA